MDSETKIAAAAFIHGVGMAVAMLGNDLGNRVQPGMIEKDHLARLHEGIKHMQALHDHFADLIRDIKGDKPPQPPMKIADYN